MIEQSIKIFYISVEPPELSAPSQYAYIYSDGDTVDFFSEFSTKCLTTSPHVVQKVLARYPECTAWVIDLDQDSVYYPGHSEVEVKGVPICEKCGQTKSERYGWTKECLTK